MARSSSVRFRVRFRPVPELSDSVRLGSVRFGSASSARFLIRSCISSPNPYGRFSEFHVLNYLPDLGSLNSCMHTSPETNDGCAMV